MLDSTVQMAVRGSAKRRRLSAEEEEDEFSDADLPRYSTPRSVCLIVFGIDS